MQAQRADKKVNVVSKWTEIFSSIGWDWLDSSGSVDDIDYNCLIKADSDIYNCFTINTPAIDYNCFIKADSDIYYCLIVNTPTIDKAFFKYILSNSSKKFLVFTSQIDKFLNALQAKDNALDTGVYFVHRMEVKPITKGETKIINLHRLNRLKIDNKEFYRPLTLKCSGGFIMSQYPFNLICLPVK